MKALITKHFSIANNITRIISESCEQRHESRLDRWSVAFSAEPEINLSDCEKREILTCNCYTHIEGKESDWSCWGPMFSGAFPGKCVNGHSVFAVIVISSVTFCKKTAFWAFELLYPRSFDRKSRYGMLIATKACPDEIEEAFSCWDFKDHRFPLCRTFAPFCHYHIRGTIQRWAGPTSTAHTTRTISSLVLLINRIPLQPPRKLLKSTLPSPPHSTLK